MLVIFCCVITRDSIWERRRFCSAAYPRREAIARAACDESHTNHHRSSAVTSHILSLLLQQALTHQHPPKALRIAFRCLIMPISATVTFSLFEIIKAYMASKSLVSQTHHKVLKSHTTSEALRRNHNPSAGIYTFCFPSLVMRWASPAKASRFVFIGQPATESRF